MAKCIISHNFLCKIENYRSVNKIVYPALFFSGSKCRLIFSSFMEKGDEKVRLVLESLNDSESLTLFEFRVAVRYVYSGGSTSSDLVNATYNLKHKELCVWSDSVANIQKNHDNLNDIKVLVIVTPGGEIETLFESQESFDEIENKSLCVKSLTEDFGRLFNNVENSDFVLKCGEKNFYVHKAILAARSEFFAGMFRSDMKEVNEGCGKIENLEPDILELVLLYIYTGEIPKLSMESLKKVFASADRLAVEPLKIKCQSLFVDVIVTDDEKEEEEDQDDPVNDETKILESKSLNNYSLSSKEKELLKGLFMTREWRLFSQEFPHKALEMCRPYLL